MKSFMDWIERTLAPAAARISEQRHMASIRDGLIATVPFLIIGSLITMILNLPITGWSELAVIAFIKPYGLNIWNGTMGIVSLLAAFGIGAHLAQRYKMDATIGGLMAVAGLVTLTPEVTGAWGMPFLTAGWLFTAMIFSLLAVEIYRFFVKRNLVIKMPDGVPPAAIKSFAALIPGTAVLISFAAIRGILFALFEISVNDVVLKLFEPLKVLGGSLGGALVAVLLVHILWAVGVHGGTIVFTIFGPFFLQAATENADAFAAGNAASHIVTGPMLDIFVYVGGAGTSLSLAILFTFLAKSKQLKALGKLSVGPALFNINEPILFGTPIIMNPLMLIPFITVPIVTCLTTYFAMALGIVPKTIALAPWTAPIIMGPLVSTGSIMGVLLQLVNVALGLAIYYPFFRIYDKMKVREESGNAATAAASASKVTA